MLPVIACYVILCSNSSGIQLRHSTRQSGHHDQTVVNSESHEYETIVDVRDLHERPANMYAEGGYQVIQEQKRAIRNIDQSYEVIGKAQK